jgi:hypothetical protein
VGQQQQLQHVSVHVSLHAVCPLPLWRDAAGELKGPLKGCDGILMASEALLLRGAVRGSLQARDGGLVLEAVAWVGVGFGEGALSHTSMQTGAE